MSSPSMETRNRNVAVEVKENINSADVPSGFILKLYEMVNGAPDDVISVSVPLPSIVGGSFNQTRCLAFRWLVKIFSVPTLRTYLVESD